MFSKQEQQRYSRQIKLPELGTKGQIKLKKSKVLVIGAGGLGCPVLQYLTVAGIGNIGIADGDKIGWSNLHRQILFNENDIGKNKAIIAAKKLAKQNSNISINPINTYLNNDNILDIIKKYDIIVDGTDNFATRYRVNDASVILNKPLIYGALSKFQGQIGVFNYKLSGTYRCVFPNPPLPENAPNCSEIGVIGVLPGIIGNYQAMETIKIITGIGQPLINKLLIIDTLSNRNIVIDYQTNKKNLIITKLENNYEHFCHSIILDEYEIDSHYLSYNDLKKYNILDVRSEKSYKNRNLGGINIPFRLLKEKINNLKTIPYLIVCEYGNTSKKALKMLLNKGLQAKHLKGGVATFFDFQKVK